MSPKKAIIILVILFFLASIIFSAVYFLQIKSDKKLSDEKQISADQALEEDAVMSWEEQESRRQELLENLKVLDGQSSTTPVAKPLTEDEKDKKRQSLLKILESISEK